MDKGLLYFPKIYRFNHTPLYGPTVRGASVELISQVRPSAMLVLPIICN
jgi:hypothetical protein